MSIINKAIKYRIYPNSEQKELINKTFGCCRKVYNLMLDDKIAYYELNKKNLVTTPAMYKETYSYLKEVDSLALANEQLNLQSAYKNFFRDKKIGFPKYKSAKHSRKSYTTNNQNGTVRIENNTIRLPKIGFVKAKLHRLAKDDWKLKSATVSKDSNNKYYASVLYEFEEDIKQVPISNNAIGLDYKSDGLYMDSNNQIGTNHKFYRDSQNKLAKLQRKLKHKVIGSNNYKKQQLRIARIHKKIANQRLDNLHKISFEITNQYDVVCVEDLNMKAISNTKFSNGKATLDNGYGTFLNLLEYKLKERGKHLVKVDKWFPSSQTCSCCGNVKKIPLSERTYKCEHCGTVIDRDFNAAINIKNEGLRLLLA